MSTTLPYGATRSSGRIAAQRRTLGGAVVWGGVAAALFATVPASAQVEEQNQTYARQQQDSAFARDRNTAVDEREHPEYAPLGLRAGAIAIQPDVDVDFDYTDNVFAASSHLVGDEYLHLAPIVAVTSDWSRNAFTAYAKASYDQYFRYTSEDVVQGGVGATYRFDTLKNSYVEFTGQYDNISEPRTATTYNLSFKHPLQYQEFSGNIKAVTELNRFRYVLYAEVHSDQYYTPTLIGGGAFDVKSLNGQNYNAHGQIEYAVNPGMSAYVYIGGNALVYPSLPNTPSRSSQGFDVAVGTNFDVTRLVRGDFRIGYLRQYYDGSVNPAGGLSVMASGYYFPTQLTTIIVTVKRAVDSSNYFAAATYVAEGGTAKIEHELFRNIILTAGGGGEVDTYNGTCTTPGCAFGRKDTLWNVQAGGTYLVNRRIRLNLNYDHQVLKSTGPNAAFSYTANNVMLKATLRY